MRKADAEIAEDRRRREEDRRDPRQRAGQRQGGGQGHRQAEVVAAMGGKADARCTSHAAVNARLKDKGPCADLVITADRARRHARAGRVGPVLLAGNTDFVVLIAFLLFIAVLVYFKVPGWSGHARQARRGHPRELDEARALREEAQACWPATSASRKRCRRRPTASSRRPRKRPPPAGEQAKEDLKESIARRMQAAEDQHRLGRGRCRQGSARSRKMTAAEGNRMIDDAIKQVDAKLH